MYLKALEIQGFKSFPDKTVLNFGEDITAIVGPNGSGKSNISDAIRWVMGEQSSKTLRGGKMEDVIFGGTEKRAPVGFAQVTLTLDNSDHGLSMMEESEVAVTRRYYRSGESEYYINRQSVRLKDVTELFMDTGMGKEGYSIVGQGRVDEILSTRSTDRREIFEEAAGISRFRHRKEEAERKLGRTEENLVRINDKIAELELQVDPLRKQAETARTYLLLRDEMRVLEISLWLENLETLKANARKLELDLRSAQNQREEARRAVDALFAENEQFGRQMQEKDMEAETLRADAAQLDSQSAEETAIIAVLESNIGHLQENIQRAQGELEETETRSDSYEAQAAEQEERAADLAAQLDALRARLDGMLREAQETAEKVGGTAEQAEALHGRETVAAAAAADARTEAAALRAETEQILSRRSAACAARETAQAQLEEKMQAAQENRRQLETAREEVETAENIISGHRLRMEERRKKAAAAADIRMKRTVDVGTLEHRIRLLTEMEKDFEGFHKAVKLVCQARNDLRGIHGPVAGLMKTDGKYSLAMEVALGAGLQNIVVDREEDAKNAIAFLKRREGGRATFLPLTAIRGEELREKSVEREPGFVGLASRLVRFDPRYTDIFRNLLGRTVIMENLDHGIATARKFGNAFRIVTLDGQVINRGGSMTGGSVSRSAGVLSRAAELEQLRGRVGELRQELRAAESAEEAANRELESAQYDLTAVEEQQRAAENEVLRLKGVDDQFAMLLAGLREGITDFSREIEDIDSRLKENGDRAAAVEQTVAERENDAREFHAQADALLAGQNELMAQSRELTETITTYKTELAALTANREALLGRAADLRQLAVELAGDRRQKQETLLRYQEQIETAQAEIRQRTAAQAELKQKSGDIAARLGAISREKIALEAERTAKSRAGQEMNETLLNLERAVSGLETKRTTSAMEEKQILDKLWETYELSHSDAQLQRVELESVAKATRRIAELKREIHGLGSINIGAIEEFERINGRYTYLTDQRDDVEKAKSDLLAIIREITERMTEIFAQQFQLLNENFAQTFVELFGGGQAKLELEDPEHILDCGIEIKAQPPGKTLKTISLLSGGEKAFVAIALYFAILKVHPTPFCIMDEIEAALDEANVVRTARYMRSLADKTQFIVITHRRGTMEGADVLYGVTMQEQGVSKILTIDLNDMARELDIE